ncbi:MAG: peptidase T, partial [bacterium]
MRACERLIRYARIHTASEEGRDTVPSTMHQFDLATCLSEELVELGAAEVGVDEHAYVYAKIPATPGYEDRLPIGFLSHMDTVPDFPGAHVRPHIVRRYDGRDIPLGTSGRVLRPSAFPHLREVIGKTLIVTDGTTVLGADDKAGIAEIMTMAEHLLAGH